MEKTIPMDLPRNLLLDDFAVDIERLNIICKHISEEIKECDSKIEQEVKDIYEKYENASRK